MARRIDKRRRALQEKFRKRSYNLLRKTNKLSQQTESDIYVFIYRNYRYYSYRSTDRAGWPASEQDVVSFVIQFYLFWYWTDRRKRDYYFQTVTCRSDSFEKSNEEHVEAQKKESEIDDQELSEETLYEQDRRVIFMPKTSLLRLEPKSQISPRTFLV